MDVIRDTIGFIVLPFELLVVVPIRNWLLAQGVIFDLYPHWKSAFVLLWLFNASWSRAFSPISRIQSIASAGDIPRAASTYVFWIWAALAALMGGVLAGTVPIGDSAVLWWPVGAWFVYRAGRDLVGVVFMRSSRLAARCALGIAVAAPFALLALGLIHPPTLAGQPATFWWAVTGFFIYQVGYSRIGNAFGVSPQSLTQRVLEFALATVSLVFALGILPTPAWLTFEALHSPGLASLVAFVVLLAGWFLLASLLSPANNNERSFLERWLNADLSRAGLDILAVVGGAATIVSVAHLLE